MLDSRIDENSSPNHGANMLINASMIYEMVACSRGSQAVLPKPLLTRLPRFITGWTRGYAVFTHPPYIDQYHPVAQCTNISALLLRVPCKAAPGGACGWITLPRQETCKPCRIGQLRMLTFSGCPAWPFTLLSSTWHESFGRKICSA